ncbi:MAG: prepilin-type N-terminal cleavage/methylation domain-containing protein [Gammaproteobacteria bacterium]
MRRKFLAPRQQAGLSLLELSIVLVITGIIPFRFSEWRRRATRAAR